MENYNENMNYSFEPMPEQSAHTQAHQEPEKPKKQKKDSEETQYALHNGISKYKLR